MKIERIILIVFMVSILAGFVCGGTEVEPDIVKQGDVIQLTQECTQCDWLNLTSIVYPNQSYVIRGEYSMTKLGSSYNFTFTNTTNLGVHTWCYHGKVDGTTDVPACLKFEVTSTGKNFNSGQSLSSLGILLGSLIVSFLFLYIGFKISVNPKMVPIAFIFIVLSIILIIYSLFLGWTIGSDIIEHEAFSETSEVIFTAVLWLMVAVVLISFILFMFSFIKEFGKQKKIGKFGEGFNPITDTYDY